MIDAYVLKTTEEFERNLSGGADGKASRCVQSYVHLSEMMTLVSNQDPAINSHPGVSQARRGIERMDVKPGVPSATVTWWMLKIPRCPSGKVADALELTTNLLISAPSVEYPVMVLHTLQDWI